MWRWASVYAGLLFTAEEYLYGMVDEGSGYMHGTDDGSGHGDGAWGNIADENSEDYDLFDFRTGEWRFQ